MQYAAILEWKERTSRWVTVLQNAADNGGQNASRSIGSLAGTVEVVLEKEEAPVIGRVTLGEKRELGARQPSVILRAVHPGEDLWTVAKAYLTTDSDIMEASGLTSGEIFPGQMLLIPRKSS